VSEVVLADLAHMLGTAKDSTSGHQSAHTTVTMSPSLKETRSDKASDALMDGRIRQKMAQV
jgi:hypothetical protein